MLDLGINCITFSACVFNRIYYAVWASIIAILFLKEKITFNKVLFLIIGLIGTFTILLPDVNQVNVYNIIVLFSAIAYAFAHNFTKS